MTFIWLWDSGLFWYVTPFCLVNEYVLRIQWNLLSAYSGSRLLRSKQQVIPKCKLPSTRAEDQYSLSCWERPTFWGIRLFIALLTTFQQWTPSWAPWQVHTLPAYFFIINLYGNLYLTCAFRFRYSNHKFVSISHFYNPCYLPLPSCLLFMILIIFRGEHEFEKWCFPLIIKYY